MFYNKLNRLMVYAAVLVMALIGIGASTWAADAQTAVPSFIVTAVTRNETVTISGSNFPANQLFSVRMGPYGGYGMNGALSPTQVNTGNGSFTATIAIPAAVRDSGRIAMRLENGSIYYSYNWFWNNSTGVFDAVATPVPTKTPVVNSLAGRIPLIGIEGINGEDVTFRTYGFPANTNFNVYMGSRSSGGYSHYIGNYNSGDGSDQNVTVRIPADIAHYGYMWLRLDSGVYSPYVGFYNPADVGTRGSGISGTSPVSTGPVPVWHGTPTMMMCAVMAGNQVTFVTNNLTTNLDYTVRMNAFGTQGYNGYVVGTVSPGNDPSVRVTMPIPAQLAGHQRIAIRMDAAGGYNAYNWFWNNSATVC